MHPVQKQKLPPLWLVKSIQCFRDFLIRLNKKMFPGNVVLYELFQNLWALPSLYVAAKLNVAEWVKDSPKSITELARLTNTHAPSLHRVMRALVAQGIFKLGSDGKFRINGMAKGLLNEPGSIRHMLIHHLGPVNWNLMSNLEYTVRTGEDAFANAYGKGIYEYLRENPQESEVFDQSMSDLSDIGLAPILNAYPFANYQTIADIGGGEGFLLANILKIYPSTKGILYDQKETTARAPQLFSNYQLNNRVQIIAGNFFEQIPSGADLYIMKSIIHNWDDEHCIKLLRNVHHAMSNKSKIVIVEMIVSDDNTLELAKLLDIQMLACMQGGKERTREEFDYILEKSGFKRTRIFKTIAPISLIEAKKST